MSLHTESDDEGVILSHAESPTDVTLGKVAVIHGDARALPLPDASVDAIVCDPPYGLEFMGKDWDSPWRKGEGIGGHDARLNPQTWADGADRLARPVFTGGTNPTCRNCGGLRNGTDGKKGQKPCRCDAPRFDNILLPRMQAFGAWSEEWAREALRVLKPGGHLIAFGGTRTWHRLVCAVEDAGFEIRDSLMWLYGSGFPKSLNVARAIDVHLTPGVPRSEAPPTTEGTPWSGWGTALKPGHEPIVLARRPLAGTVAANVLAHGTGALNIDGCRVGSGTDKTPAPTSRRDSRPWFTTASAANLGGNDHVGRWPTNVLLSHAPLLDPAGEVIGDACADGCVAGCPVAELDTQSGVLASGVVRNGGSADGGNGVTLGRMGPLAEPRGYGDSGGASRFFPSFRYQAKAPSKERPRVDGVAHPTVKPVALMRWLVRLVTPPGGLVLDPFAGSGTTGEAAAREGLRAVLVEAHEPYLALIGARLDRLEASA